MSLRHTGHLTHQGRNQSGFPSVSRHTHLLLPRYRLILKVTCLPAPARDLPALYEQYALFCTANMLKDYEIQGQNYRLKDSLDCIPAAMKSYGRISGQDIPVRTGMAGDVSLVHTNGQR